MCQSNIWAVNGHAYTPEFRAETSHRLGVEPADVDLRIGSSRVRSSARHFELVPNMCNCGSLIGLKGSEGPSDGVQAVALLEWIRELGRLSANVSRLALLWAWSPQDEVLTPVRARGIRVEQLSEQVLRTLGENELLTIDYPPRCR